MAEELRQLLDDDGESGPKGQGEAAARALGQEAATNRQRRGGTSAGVGKASTPITPRGTGRQLIDEVSGATRALRTRLQGVLAAAKRSKRSAARRGKRVDPRRLVKGLTGDPRIFVSKTEGVAVNTAVQIVMDRSGSMCSNIELARESTLACALSLEAIEGVNVGAVAFPGYRTQVEPLTGFGETVRRTAGRYAGVQATGGTPMLEALLWAVDDLLMQPEPRKICLVITDGHPNNREGTAEIIRRCTAGGVEVMGIGLGGGARYVHDLFPVSTHVAGIEQLAGAMFTMMREALMGRPPA